MIWNERPKQALKIYIAFIQLSVKHTCDVVIVNKINNYGAPRYIREYKLCDYKWHCDNYTMYSVVHIWSYNFIQVQRSVLSTFKLIVDYLRNGFLLK